ncbi:MAG: PepSY domain-containing protein [Gemmatimonadaceae bacterium]
MSTRSLIATLALLAAALPGSAQRAHAQVTVHEETPGLLKRAKVTPMAATATALARVKGGKVTKAEIEMEDGRLIYSFDLAVAGKSGVDEVGVDAMTGAVIGVEHESPAAEKAEAAKEKAEKAKAKAKPHKPAAGGDGHGRDATA